LITPENRGEMYSKINENGTKYSGNIRTEIYNGDVNQISLENDSVYWNEIQTNKKMKNPTDNLIEINFINHKKGAAEGLGYGFLIGGLGGMILGFGLGGDSPGSGGMVKFTAGEKALAVGAFFGILGGLGGLAVGATNGSIEKYIFDKEKLDLEIAKRWYHLEGASVKSYRDAEYEISWRGKIIILPMDEVRIIEKDDESLVFVPEKIYREKLR
jgi:hypothetical protein